MRPILLALLLPLISFAQTDNPFGLPVSSTACQVVHHAGYTLCYNEKNEQSAWVAYMLTRDRASVTIPRTDNFRADPAITTGSASLDDYKGSVYDRGHLFPAADAWSDSSMSESFFLSNMTPQNASFNRGIWAVLEAQVRKLSAPRMGRRSQSDGST